MEVTVQNVTNGLAFAQQFDDDVVNEAIDTAKSRATADGLNPKLDEFNFNLGVKQYARHLLYINSFYGNGNVTAASTFGNSQTIADKSDNDAFLQQYNNTVKLFGNGGDDVLWFL